MVDVDELDRLRRRSVRRVFGGLRGRFLSVRRRFFGRRIVVLGDGERSVRSAICRLGLRQGRVSDQRGFRMVGRRRSVVDEAGLVVGFQRRIALRRRIVSVEFGEMVLGSHGSVVDDRVFGFRALVVVAVLPVVLRHGPVGDDGSGIWIVPVRRGGRRRLGRRRSDRSGNFFRGADGLIGPVALFGAHHEFVAVVHIRGVGFRLRHVSGAAAVGFAQVQIAVMRIRKVHGHYGFGVGRADRRVRMVRAVMVRGGVDGGNADGE
ncbi:unnamed protein product, partial [Nesidiocoris tenuis]